MLDMSSLMESVNNSPVQRYPRILGAAGQLEQSILRPGGVFRGFRIQGLGYLPFNRDTKF